MTFTLKIKCDNEAFHPEPAIEISRILMVASLDIVHGWTEGGSILDINGNNVGSYTLTGMPRRKA